MTKRQPEQASTDLQNNATCMDDFDPNSLPIDVAKARILESIEPLKSYVKIAIRGCLNRVLAKDIVSPINVPAYTNSAMDGYAIKGKDIPSTGETELSIVATIMAGQPTTKSISTGQCTRIMTGGKMPKGADTVIMQEHVTRNNDTIRINNSHNTGQNVRQAGEDLAVNDLVLNAGHELNSADIGLLASIGIPETTVYRKLRIAFFSTGDELRSIGEPLNEGQIYDSNRYTIHSMLTRLGVDIIDMGVIPDDKNQIREAFALAASQADALITSGGVSVGEADYVKEILEEIGHVDFWKIAMKPGRPLAFGNIDNCLFFGLPGNPVSVMVTFYQFVLPALKKLSGQSTYEPTIISITCQSSLKKSPGRVELQRGILDYNNDGRLVVFSTGEQGSGILCSMSKANCFIILPMECKSVEPGDVVSVQPFAGLI